ncbi:flavodoxin [Mannheimia indoligenes]|uniref:flavodoxin n=1 Tax=Mannheimia indoligenes TaxID=3103145 RepID=UPI002FE66DE3
MKLKIFAIFTTFLTACSVQAKPLVIYFSQPEKVEINNIDAYSGASAILKENTILGATEYLAKEIQKHTGADLFRIETVQNYPIDTHQNLLDFAQEEQRKGIKPALKAKPDLSGYDTVFVGFPIWWYQMPMPLYSFFEPNDFSGKKVVLFVAHGGSRFSGATQVIRKMQPNAEVIEGFEAYLYKTTRADSGVEKRLENWLNTLGK